MAPTLTATPARVRLLPPKPPPRLAASVTAIDRTRTPSNAHTTKPVPHADVVAAARLTLATLRAGDARAARRRCVRAGFQALRVGVATERVERAAAAVRRREAAAGEGPKSSPRWVKALVASEARTAAAAARRMHGVALAGVARAADAVVAACAAAAAASVATARADNRLLLTQLAAAKARHVHAATEARRDAQKLHAAADAAHARVAAAAQALRDATDAANIRVAAADKALLAADMRARASESASSEVVAVARARVRNAEARAHETEAAAQEAVTASRRAIKAADARAAGAEAETKQALAAVRASIPDGAVSRALAARWRCAAAVSAARRVADHCYVGLAADAATDARDETVSEQHAHAATADRMHDAEVDAHQTRETLGAVERRSARVERVAAVVAHQLGAHAAGGVLRARVLTWRHATEASKVREQAARQVARLAGRSRPRASRAFHRWRRRATADVMSAARIDEAAEAAIARADDVCELIDALRASALRRLARASATRQTLRRRAFAEWRVAALIDANDHLDDERSRLLLLQSLWAARMEGGPAGPPEY